MLRCAGSGSTMSVEPAGTRPRRLARARHHYAAALETIACPRHDSGTQQRMAPARAESEPPGRGHRILYGVDRMSAPLWCLGKPPTAAYGRSVRRRWQLAAVLVGERTTSSVARVTERWSVSMKERAMEVGSCQSACRASARARHAAGAGRAARAHVRGSCVRGRVTQLQWPSTSP